jgi:hypothetical protein
MDTLHERSSPSQHGTDSSRWMRMAAVSFSEKIVTIHQIMCHHIQDRSNIHKANHATSYLTDQTSCTYRVPQEERSIFWQVIVSVILSKKLYVHVSYSERFP